MVRRLAATGVLALALVAGAAADGDPASDVLLQQNVFFPIPAPSADAQKSLNQAVEAAYAKGFRVKVAVVAAQSDLGAIPSLFNRPSEYAKFLGTELQFLYVGPLLIVMPAGVGIYDGARSTAAEDAVLARLKVSGASADELTRSAASTVGELLRTGALRSKDVLPPYVQVSQASGQRGRPLKLQYRIYDDSGKASAVLQVVAPPGHAVATFRVPLRPTAFQTSSSVVWKVPRTVKPGQVKVCLTATDPSGNRSRRACEAILVT
jgi:hypothetical protein